jgi:phosphohistidine phosphatase
VTLYLVHHGAAVGPEIDPRRPLSDEGREEVERLARDAARRGARPDIVWHSGKLRARQTAEAFWRACNALAEFSATRDLQPDDPPGWIRDRLLHETRKILIAGHFPHLPKLLALLMGAEEGTIADFPQHGVVALRTDDQGRTWVEEWRSGADG